MVEHSQGFRIPTMLSILYPKTLPMTLSPKVTWFRDEGWISSRKTFISNHMSRASIVKVPYLFNI